MSSYCDFDPPEFFSEKVHTARLEHPCCECHAPILVGDVLGDGCVYFGGLQEWWNDGRPWRVLVAKPMWRIGARMVAMIRRREKLDRRKPFRAAKPEAAVSP